MNLKNKVVIVTGSARGMGREIALRFAKEGAKITVCDILDCKPVADELKALGAEVLALKTDVTSEAATVEMAKKTAEKFGTIDVLVNNAAIFGGIENKNFVKPFDQITVDEWDKLMAVNLKGMFLCCKAVVPYMKKQGYGKIVNIASTVPYMGTPIFLHYTTSKGGVVAMTRSLAMGLGQFNINVNAVAPGLTSTEAAASITTPEALNNAMSKMALKRRTQPQHIAAGVAFLASEDADQITGQVLGVNGGEALI